MKRVLKWTGLGLVGLISLVIVVVVVQVFRYDQSMSAVLEVPPVNLGVVSDSTLLARGEHLATSFGGCTGCHGPDLSGSPVESFGPIGTMSPPNITTGQGGVGSQYTDAELARAIRHGIGRDGTSLSFMPTEEHAWWPDADVQAVVAYVRSVPPVDVQREPSSVGVLGKVLTGFGVMDFRSAIVAAKSDHGAPPDPEPTARYGAFLALSCKGCHGAELSGGPIPGAPADLAVPSNLTPHETGLKDWTYDDFKTLLATARRPDGSVLDEFMPTENLNRMSNLEKTAMWEYLRTIEPRETGQ